MRARVNRLLESGSIRITAVGNYFQLGLKVVAICLIRVRPGHVQESAEALRAYPHVRFVGTSFGSADIIIQTLHPDIGSLHRFMSVELPRALPHVTYTETFQLAEVVKSAWNWKAWFAQLEGREEPEVPEPVP